MFFGKKKKGYEVHAYLTGEVLTLDKVDDPMFSGRVLGDGIAIMPTDGALYSPVDGEITTIFDTKHAIGFRLSNDAELLLHIGIDTVELNGNGFDLTISVGDQVKAGDRIGTVDLDYLKKNNKDVVTPILLTTMDDHKINFVKTEGAAKIGDVLYKVTE